MKKLLLALALLAGHVMMVRAQDRQIQGIVFDQSTKQRLSRVYIYDVRTHKGIYNNIRGEFTMNVRQGDTLIVALQGYAVDTVTVQSQNAFIFYLVPTSILLKEVVIIDSVLTPAKKLEQIQQEYKDIYRIGSSKDLLNVGKGGVGVGIDAIYSLLSREGKNARHLQKIIESDYRDAIIDYRFTQTLVNNVTGLSGNKLKDFMLQYRPDYYFVLEASEYAFAAYIKANYARYVEDPAAFRLPSLK